MFHHCQFPDLPEGWNDDTCLILDCESTKSLGKINLCASWGICYSKHKANTLVNCSFLVSYWFLFLCLTSKYFTDKLFSRLPTFFSLQREFYEVLWLKPSIYWWLQTSIFCLNLSIEFQTPISLFNIFTQCLIHVSIQTQNSWVINDKTHSFLTLHYHCK